MGNFNSVVFPSPEPSYSNSDYFVYWIPSQVKQKKIPIIFYETIQDIKRLIIFFHGNAEDAGIAYNFMEAVCMQLDAHGLIVEYPGYGVYDNEYIDEKSIFQDSLSIFDFAVNEMGFDPQNIIIFGRSIGSGPATYLASQRRALCLILFSAFLSIKDVAKDKVGLLSLFKSQIFENKKHIINVESPILFIHGQADNVIDYKHSVKLMEQAVNSLEKQSFYPAYMTHNYFNFESELIFPIYRFLDKIRDQQNSHAQNPRTNEILKFKQKEFEQIKNQCRYSCK